MHAQSGTGSGSAWPAKKGLGVKKAATVDFAEAEWIHQLGYDRESKEAEAKAAREAAALLV